MVQGVMISSAGRLVNLQNRVYHVNSLCFSASRPGYIIRIDFGFIAIDCVPYAEIFLLDFGFMNADNMCGLACGLAYFA